MKKIIESRKLLGIDKSADLKELKAIYRNFMKEWHPDKFQDDHTRKLEAEEKSKRALSMAQQTKKGVVYIISNVGSFGEQVFKIGLTRRLQPQDRVDELGDASVPFEFDVHAFIESDNAPALDAITSSRSSSVFTYIIGLVRGVPDRRPRVVRSSSGRPAIEAPPSARKSSMSFRL